MKKLAVLILLFLMSSCVSDLTRMQAHLDEVTRVPTYHSFKSWHIEGRQRTMDNTVISLWSQDRHTKILTVTTEQGSFFGYRTEIKAARLSIDFVIISWTGIRGGGKAYVVSDGATGFIISIKEQGATISAEDVPTLYLHPNYEEQEQIDKKRGRSPI